METLNVFPSCVISFLAVFILLGVLAALIKLVDAVFPDKSREDDGPIIAAIHTTIAARFPGGRVIRIEEIQK